jgi:hypothetical protein
MHMYIDILILLYDSENFEENEYHHSPLDEGRLVKVK